MHRSSTILTVTSGKGGVGKSVIAVNLAEVLVGQGYRVALLDADFGLGDCAVLLNEQPAAAVLDLARHAALREEVLHTTGRGLTLIQSVAAPGDADGRERTLYATLDTLLHDLRDSYDYVLIDTPAGTDGPVRWALDRADLGLLVLVGEPTAVANAYRLAKLTYQADPDYPLSLVVNFADTTAEADSVADRFGELTRRFTGQTPTYLGWVPYAATLRQSVRQQHPAVLNPGAVCQAFVGLADTLTAGTPALLTPA